MVLLSSSKYANCFFTEASEEGPLVFLRDVKSHSNEFDTSSDDYETIDQINEYPAKFMNFCDASGINCFDIVEKLKNKGYSFEHFDNIAKLTKEIDASWEVSSDSGNTFFGDSYERMLKVRIFDGTIMIYQICRSNELSYDEEYLFNGKIIEVKGGPFKNLKSAMQFIEKECYMEDLSLSDVKKQLKDWIK